MQEDPINSRKQLVRPGLAIIFAVLGLIGAACFVSWYAIYACAGLAAVAAVILLAQSVDKVLAGRKPVDGAAVPAFPRHRSSRVQFRLRTLLMLVTVTGLFLGLSKCNLAYPHSMGEDPRYYISYGFPFRCVEWGDCNSAGFQMDVYSDGSLFPCVDCIWVGRNLLVDFLWLAADLAVGGALVVGLEMESQHAESRPRHKT